MKLLSKRFASNFEPEKTGVVFFADKDVETQAASKTEKLEEALERPVYFTTARLRELQKNPDILKDPKMRKKFNGVIRYYLSLLDPTKPSSPAFYTLFRIAGDTVLNNSLGKDEKAKIKAFVNERVANVNLSDIDIPEISDSAEDELGGKQLSPEGEKKAPVYQYWELFHLYMALKNHAGVNEKTKIFVEKLRKNLGGIHRYYLATSNKAKLKGDNPLDSFNNADRLFLVQLNTLFQSESQTSKNYVVSSVTVDEVDAVRELTQNFVQELKQKISNKEALSDLLVDPEMMAYWEYILELDDSTTGLELTEAQRLQVQNLITRKKACDLVEVLNDLPVMLPQHYGSLVGLRKSLHDSGEMDLLDVKSLDNKIDSYQDQIANSKMQVREKENQVLLDKIARLDAAYSNDSGSTERVREFNEALANFKKVQPSAKEKVKSINSFDRLSSSPDNGLDSIYDVERIEHVGLSGEQAQYYKKSYQELVDTVNALWPGEGVDMGDHKTVIAPEAEAFIESEKNYQEQETEKLEKALETRDTALQISEIDRPIGSLLNVYQTKVKNRFDTGRLEYADIEVLLDSEERIPDISSEKVECLRKTREGIVDILSAEAEKVFLSGDKDKAVSFVNKKLLSIAGARSLVIEKNEHILLDYSTLGAVQNQMIQASFPRVQEKIFSFIGSSSSDKWSDVKIENSPERRYQLESGLGKSLEEYADKQKMFEGVYAESVHYLHAYCDKEGIKPFPEGFAEQNMKALHKIYIEGGTFSTGNGVEHTFPGVNRLLTVASNSEALLSYQESLESRLLVGLGKMQGELRSDEEIEEAYNDLKIIWKEACFDSCIDELELEFSHVYQDDPDLLNYLRKGYFSQLKGYKTLLDREFSRPFKDLDIKDFMDNVKGNLRAFRQHFDVKDGHFYREMKLMGEAFTLSDPGESVMTQIMGNIGDGFAMAAENNLFKTDDEGDLKLDENKNVSIDEEQFTSRWGIERKRIGSVYQGYQDQVRRMRDRISDDMSDLSKEDFQDKYGFDPIHGGDHLEKYDKSIDAIDGWWNKFSDDNYPQNWIDRYKESDSAGQAVLMSELSDWEAVATNTENLKESSDEFVKWEKDYQNSDFGDSWTKWMIRKRKKFAHKAQSIVGTWEVHTFSLMDVYQVWQKFWEGRETIRKRRSDQEVAVLGQFFTFGQSSKEFRRMGEDSEEQRVKEYAGNYEDLDNYQIKDVLYKTNDVDEARACMDLLSKSGWLQWGDPGLWRTLMRLGGGEVFNIPEDHYTDQQKIEDKVRKSCRVIWSDKIFERWQNEKCGNLTSAMKQYENEFDRLEKTEINTSALLSSILERWARGDVDSDEVNPVKYEAFLDQAFKKGKLNGNPDPRIYFLIMGVSVRNPKTGQALLDIDVFNRFQALMNEYPYIEFFIDSRSPKQDGKIVPEDKVTGAWNGNTAWTPKDFDIWRDRLGSGNGKYEISKSNNLKKNLATFFYENITTSRDANTRISRKIDQAPKFDHDDAFTFSSGYTAIQTGTALTVNSNSNLKETNDFWLNFLVGQNQNLFGKQRQIKNGDLLYGPEDEGWKKMRESLLLDVGKHLGSTYVALQMLWGNGNLSDRSGQSQQFDDRYKNKGGSYGVQAGNELRGTLNVALKALFKEGKDRYNLSDDQIELIEFDKTDPSKTSFSDKKLAGDSPEDEKTRIKSSKEVLFGQKSGLFSDAEAIEKALDTYCSQVNQSDDGYQFKLT